ncbi:hypothetical protein EVAR_51422_1 [Eumeta japonica]|uniref:Uncharacterized protein n=1 Tax=Eumeta variegata TaxID=151549 RepID=A0A4C1XTY5_EUMVA|nr:hypothetical protein EVAR_51422_1 [Eumeta japonica]
MTYASTSSLTPPGKHYSRAVYEGRIEAILRHRGITSMRSFARRLTINRRLPLHLIRRPRNVLYDPPDASLTAAVEALMTPTTRITDLE